MQMQTACVSRCVCVSEYTNGGKRGDKAPIHVLYVDLGTWAQRALMSPACVIYHAPFCLGFGPSHLMSVWQQCYGMTH